MIRKAMTLHSVAFAFLVSITAGNLLFAQSATELSSRPESALFADAVERPAFLPPQLSNTKPQTLTISPTTTPLSTFIGLGVEFDPYEKTPTPAHWKTMMDRLASLKPGFLRVMSNTSDYCSSLDANGKPVYRWLTTPNDRHLQRMYDVLDFAQSHNIPVYLGEWSPPTALGIKVGDPRWATMIADFVQYLVNERHYTVVRHYIMMNEPHGDWMWHKPAKPDFAAWATGIKQLRTELDARNLQRITLAGPDADPRWTALVSTRMPELFSAYEIHIYAKDAELTSGSLEQQLLSAGAPVLANDPHGAEKPRFIGEAGLASGKITDADQQPRVFGFDYGVLMADYAVQVARAGWAGASAWDLDDAMHDGPKGGLKIWGFWNSTTDEGMALRPWFYTWTVLSRTLPANAKILPVEGPAIPIRATAATWHSTHGTQYTVVLVNDQDTPATTTVNLPATKPWHIFRYFPDDQKTTPEGLPKESLTTKPTNHQTITFPTKGVVVLTTDWSPN